MNIKNFVDLHFHIGPEPVPRRFTIPKLIKLENGKIRTIALKNHFYPTTPIINSFECPPELRLVGSVVLNNYVGGLNPGAVYSAAKISDSRIVVWFPTISAQNFLLKSKYEIPLEWGINKSDLNPSKKINGIRILDKNLNITKESKAVLKSVYDNNCILATGHISWQEANVLVSEALGVGIDGIIITHPIYQPIDMPIGIQIKLTENKGVYVEHCYSMSLIDKIPMTKISKQIKAVGADRCIISSDTGQVGNPGPSEALGIFAHLLKKNEISEGEINKMAEANPNKLIR